MMHPRVWNMIRYSSPSTQRKYVFSSISNQVVLHKLHPEHTAEAQSFYYLDIL